VYFKIKNELIFKADFFALDAASMATVANDSAHSLTLWQSR